MTPGVYCSPDGTALIIVNYIPENFNERFGIGNYYTIEAVGPVLYIRELELIPYLLSSWIYFGEL